MKSNGRPTKWEPKFDDMLIEHMKEGYSFESFAGRIGVAISTIKLWVHKQPTFSAAKNIGRGQQLFKDEQTGQKFIEGKQKGNAHVWKFKMQNCHGWSDRREETVTTQSIEDVLRKAKEEDNEDVNENLAGDISTEEN